MTAPLLRLVACGLVLAPTSGRAADPRCARGKGGRAERFSAEALPGKTELERYQELVTACGRAEALALAQALVAFPTVGHSSGPVFASMARHLERWAKERGLFFRATDKNAVFEVGFGEGPAALGLLTHGDVVPAQAKDWKRPPFSGVVVDGRLHGRGAEDDKGPVAATLVALALARELRLAPRGTLLAIIGNGEEGDWTGMESYAAQPRPTHVISVDANFPVVTAQSAFGYWQLELDVGAASPSEAAPYEAVLAQAGEFGTQVPGEARLVVRPRERRGEAELRTALAAALAELAPSRPNLKVKLSAHRGDSVLIAQGRAIHSTLAEQGHNALWDLAAVAARLPLADNGVSRMLKVVASRLDQDHYGEKLGLAYSDPVMGKLLVVPTGLRTDKGRVRLSINLRRPKGMDAVRFRERLTAAATKLAVEVAPGLREGRPYVGEPHVATLDGPLVSELLAIYRRRFGPAEPLAIRGGTYARLFPGAVDFGPTFPGELYTGHSVDESMSVESLGKLTELLAEAVYRLGIAGPGADGQTASDVEVK